MKYVEVTMVNACIALLVVEGVLGVHHASLKYRRRADQDDMTCGVGPYDKKCCPEGAANATEDALCACRCSVAITVAATAAGDSYCLAGFGPSEHGQFTTVSYDEVGDSVADGTGSFAHSNRLHGFFLYTLWSGIVLILILASLYAHQQ